MAEVLGTTDLHTIGVGSSILPFATNERFFSLSYAESSVIGQHGRLWLSQSWFNSKPRNQSVYGVTVGDIIIVKMSLWSLVVRNSPRS